jgi:hypothetical protein
MDTRVKPAYDAVLVVRLDFTALLRSDKRHRRPQIHSRELGFHLTSPETKRGRWNAERRALV